MSFAHGSDVAAREPGPGVTFVRRPTSVPPDVRPEWKIPLLLIMIKKCRGAKASREQLHVLNTIFLNPNSYKSLIGELNGRPAPVFPIVQYEEAFDRALNWAEGFGLVTVTDSNRFELSELGDSIVTAINLNDSLFTSERMLLDALPNSLTQSSISQVLAKRRQL